jgi:GMP synthase-like glutamine amidotransferase
VEKSDPAVTETVPTEAARAPALRRPRVIVLQHHERVPLGALGLALEREAHLTHLRGYLDPDGVRAAVDRLTAGGDYDGVIALGGPMGVYDDARYPFLLDSLRLLEDALIRGAPIVGLCLGSQLLSQALGSRVFPGTERGLAPEVGYFPLRLTDEGRLDPAIALYGQGDPVLFWHGDTHDLPSGAVLLATSDRYPLAGFRHGRWAHGYQFHLEITMEWLGVWLERSPLAGEPDVDPAQILGVGALVAPANAARATQLARGFIQNARAYSAG